jgi:hypothetical protein
MNDDFKKLDEWMMNASKKAREKKVPEKDLQDFHDNVMKKILERQNAAPGFPYAGLAAVAAFSLAVIFGAVMYMHSVKVEKNETEKAQTVENQRLDAIHSGPSHYASLDGKDDGKQFMSGSLSSAEGPTRVPLTEASIVDEIEALKEIGAWTEEDEAEAGIPVEVTFGDLEVGMEYSRQPIPAAVQN